MVNDVALVSKNALKSALRAVVLRKKKKQKERRRKKRPSNSPAVDHFLSIDDIYAAIEKRVIGIGKRGKEKKRGQEKKKRKEKEESKLFCSA